MLVQTQRQLQTLLIAVAVTSLAGCGQSGFDSHFVFSDGTEALMNEAQTSVKDLVTERFGTPQELKAWTKLPIQFGGVVGTVTVSPDPDAAVAVKELSLEFDGEVVLQPNQPIQIQFVTGAAAPSVVQVENWSAENGIAGLMSAMELAPAAGDMVVLNGGGLLKHGRGLYMRHCSHCHGTSGDGNGPTARYLNPRPRDYRHGVFKFTSTNDQAKVSHDDLHRVLRNGIPGTYMPSFVPMLKDEDVTAVAEYVRFLAMRGEFERKVVNEVTVDYSQEAVNSRRANGETRTAIVEDFKEFLTEDLPESLEFVSDDLATVWTDADSPDSLIVPDSSRVPDSPESRRRGRELFLSKALNCADCHGIAGKGNGPQTTIFEEKDKLTKELYPEPGLHDVWDRVNQPRNLTQGIYRGGRRPVDLFYRIHAGIKGTRMPSFKTLKHEDIWHLVNYVLSIPFEPEPGHGPVPDLAPAAPSTASL